MLDEIAQLLYEDAIETMSTLIAWPAKQQLARMQKLDALKKSEHIEDRLAFVLYQQYQAAKAAKS